MFGNVSKGQLAKKEDLVKAFGTADQTQVRLDSLLIFFYYNVLTETLRFAKKS